MSTHGQRFRRHRTPVITDAPMSPTEERRHRERVYSTLMAVHLVGLTIGALLYFQAFWVGLAILIVTGPLPWVAVVLANERTRRPGGPGHVSSPHDPGTSDS
ncbi:DUF3099 domain-containing protein [Pseudonocardia asaccharolytica]|uniref:DUF3099 domain-containing protein n=1 Tax=Pseudonocardia asaccharolytica DSM 44247 = NBRC 16224 TaxID=1123024 RepID=A0A511D4A9_9PSEU|nr:DUF3099 domain-containing protein [Pseudonocardia asaccharolytica]GEL19611.1 hypothetical protein PA7_34480 [Pseudonocardia asaccharolytica DSM 44247 = NBRC 16224]